MLEKLKREYGVKVVATRERPGANLVINCEDYASRDSSICSKGGPAQRNRNREQTYSLVGAPMHHVEHEHQAEPGPVAVEHIVYTQPQAERPETETVVVYAPEGAHHQHHPMAAYEHPEHHEHHEHAAEQPEMGSPHAQGQPMAEPETVAHGQPESNEHEILHQQLPTSAHRASHGPSFEHHELAYVAQPEVEPRREQHTLMLHPMQRPRQSQMIEEQHYLRHEQAHSQSQSQSHSHAHAQAQSHAHPHPHAHSHHHHYQQRSQQQQPHEQPHHEHHERAQEAAHGEPDTYGARTSPSGKTVVEVITETSAPEQQQGPSGQEQPQTQLPAEGQTPGYSQGAAPEQPTTVAYLRHEQQAPQHQEAQGGHTEQANYSSPTPATQTTSSTSGATSASPSGNGSGYSAASEMPSSATGGEMGMANEQQETSMAQESDQDGFEEGKVAPEQSRS